MTGFLIVVVAIAAAVIAYPQLPAYVPSHWGFHGEVNGYAPRWTVPIVLPAIMILVMLLYVAIPWLSPRRFEVEGFRTTYEFIMLLGVLFLGYIHLLIIWTALGHHLDMSRTVMAGVCLLLALIGNVFGRLRRNFYIGIRTPWTLADERVWIETHRWAARVFTLCGVLGLAVIFLTESRFLPLIFVVIPGIASSVYSLVIYKRYERAGTLASSNGSSGQP